MSWQKLAIIVGGGIVFIVVAYFVIKGILKSTKKEKAEVLKSQLKTEASSQGLDIDLVIKDAERIYYDAFKADRWYTDEDERLAISIIKKYSRDGFQVLATTYFKLFDEDLGNHCKKYIDDPDEYQEIVSIII